MSVVSSVETRARRVTDRLEVVRWSRYGKRRLYVNTPVGTPVGWVDLITGERSLAMPEFAGAFEAAVADQEAAIPAPYAPRRALEQVRVNPAPRYAMDPLPQAEVLVALKNRAKARFRAVTTPLGKGGSALMPARAGVRKLLR